MGDAAVFRSCDELADVAVFGPPAPLTAFINRSSRDSFDADADDGDAPEATDATFDDALVGLPAPALLPLPTTPVLFDWSSPDIDDNDGDDGKGPVAANVGPAGSIIRVVKFSGCAAMVARRMRSVVGLFGVRGCCCNLMSRSKSATIS